MRGETLLMRKVDPTDYIFFMLYTSGCANDSVACMTSSNTADRSWLSYTSATNDDYLVLVAAKGELDWQYRTLMVDQIRSTLTGPSIVYPSNKFTPVNLQLNLVDSNNPGSTISGVFDSGVLGSTELNALLNITVTGPAGLPVPLVNATIGTQLIVLSYLPTGPGTWTVTVTLNGGTNAVVARSETVVFPLSPSHSKSSSISASPSNRPSRSGSSSRSPSRSTRPSASSSMAPSSSRSRSSTISPSPSPEDSRRHSESLLIGYNDHELTVKERAQLVAERQRELAEWEYKVLHAKANKVIVANANNRGIFVAASPPAIGLFAPLSPSQSPSPSRSMRPSSSMRPSMSPGLVALDSNDNCCMECPQSPYIGDGHYVVNVEFNNVWGCAHKC
eukprot:TRINITY_DN8670_c0_g1_i1.p1 TRINITY_DN8670_c0_g1~~TRINITY_DN8670_c0_g1_i1.p1  ORF type:complete len:390 (+),score=42.35 TRINITY_DN8670_c0_g1_i1:162-1331(+)